MTDKKWVDKDGNLWNGNSIIVDDMEIFNPQEEQLLAAGYTEYVEHEPTYQEQLYAAKHQKLYDITTYDRSDNVNSFEIHIGDQTLSTWFSPNQRANYKSSVDAAELLGIESINIIINGQEIEIPTQLAKYSLAHIQLYADECFRVTEIHKNDIKQLTTIEEVNNYDITFGYPNKPSFEIPYEINDDEESEPEEEQQEPQEQDPEIEENQPEEII